MNQDDKVKHIDATRKDMTQICFEECFSQKKFVLDFNCITTCYHKYIYAANHIQKLLIEEGRACSSEFVTNAVGAEPRDRFREEIFPTGGIDNRQDENSTPFRRKFYESYMYSDPAKSGW